jgi:alpha-D-xyloside xylohydrolase
MVGESLLVAPVIAEGATSRTVYLPAGANWIDAATDALYQGGLNATVSAPVGRTPVFVRAGAVIPKGPVNQYVDEQPLRDVRLHLYPGPSTAFSLYEDDGVTFQYRQNAFLRTAITRSNESSQLLCVIRRDAGSWVPAADRRWWMEFHRAGGHPTSVALGSSLLVEVATEADLDAVTSGWAYLDGDRVLVKVPDAASEFTVRVVQ